MATKSREVIWGGRIMGEDPAQGARERAEAPVREDDHAKAEALGRAAELPYRSTIREARHRFYGRTARSSVTPLSQMAASRRVNRADLLVPCNLDAVHFPGG